MSFIRDITVNLDGFITNSWLKELTVESDTVFTIELFDSAEHVIAEHDGNRVTITDKDVQNAAHAWATEFLNRDKDKRSPFYEMPARSYAARVFDNDALCETDAILSDVILQYAIFGEERYA